MPPTHDEMRVQWLTDAYHAEELPPVEAAPDRDTWAAARLLKEYGLYYDPVLSPEQTIGIVEIVHRALDEFEGREPALIALAQRVDMLLDGAPDAIEVDDVGWVVVVPGFLLDMVRDTRRGIDLGPEHGGTGAPPELTTGPPVLKSAEDSWLEDRDG